MDAKQLAARVIEVLDLQAEYFRTRNTTKLNECRDAERKLRKTCKDIINPPTAGLFDAPQQ